MRLDASKRRVCFDINQGRCVMDCHVCKKPNAQYGNLSRRFCSAECANQFLKDCGVRDRVDTKDGKFVDVAPAPEATGGA